MKQTTNIQISISIETDEPDPVTTGGEPRRPMSPGAERLREYLRSIYAPIDRSDDDEALLAEMDALTEELNSDP
jgi:hypothetical protein